MSHNPVLPRHGFGPNGKGHAMNLEKTLPMPPEQPDALQDLLWNRSAPSLQSRCIVALLRLLRVKNRLGSVAAVQAHVRKLALHPASHEPTGLGPGVAVTLTKSARGWPVYHVRPTANPDTENCVLFLHGGGYIHEIVRAHWKLIGALVRAAQVRFVVPIYPLIPHATAREVVPGTGEVLRKVLEEAGAAKVTVLGNSAGAGLAVAAAQWLRDVGDCQPDRLILISPGLDFTLSHPEQQAIARRDPINDIPGTRELGRLYAGDLPITHPYVSPLRGNFRGLAPMTVFAGTFDLLYPDSVELAAKARAARVPVELHVGKDQPHNYAGMPTPEGRAARAVILNALKSEPDVTRAAAGSS